jgi:hypothetical protein
LLACDKYANFSFSDVGLNVFVDLDLKFIVDAIAPTSVAIGIV